MYIHLVKQFQEDTPYWDKTIHTFINHSDAQKKCDELNELYSDPTNPYAHYYEIESIELETSEAYPDQINTPRELIRALIEIENLDSPLSLIYNDGNPEDDRYDSPLKSIEVHGADTESPTIFLT